MVRNANPFDTLYLTETIDPGGFVEVFSPLLVHETSSLFRPGNVILMGTQGSGKSMLLTLLKPETRLAYERAGKPFPLDDIAGPFVGAGINLTRSGAIDFGQRPLGVEGADQPEVLEAFFADFMNYWLVRDLLASVITLAGEGNSSRRRPPILRTDQPRLDRFASGLARADCWSGALSGVDDFAALNTCLSARIRTYRDFLNYNVAELPAAVVRTKTSAGEPLAVAAEALRGSGVVAANVEFFVRIDQYEELSRLEDWQGVSGLKVDYGAVINKMLGLRDPRVSYRIGTRRHAWRDRPRMQGTSAVLEELRNYKILDLDDVLRRAEHRTSRFPGFAEDVFRRRMSWAGYECPPEGHSCIGAVFGPTPDAQSKARLYVRSASYRPAMPQEWPENVQQLIETLAVEDPLAARLADAYARQKGPNSIRPDADGFYPWDRKEWWRKERVAQALLQIAAKQRQRMVWIGRQDVIGLSGGNVLVFVSLCQSIWDVWRRTSESPPNDPHLPEIPRTYVQDEGVQLASLYWFNKIRSDPDGDSRQRFVRLVGEMFREALRDDSSMSYPGHNGFSIDVEELEGDQEVKEFLREAAAYGVLVDRLHTTRSKGGGRRLKWYLASIYAPFFQIPVAHVKEPLYVHTKQVREWLRDAGILLADQRPQELARQIQPTLFDV